jgi:pimeloyl-ACP methyl ester carboxylesterase
VSGGCDLEHHVAMADGVTLFCRDYAAPAHLDSGVHDSRPLAPVPVLCLPGLTRNSRDFEPLARHLSSVRRVLTPDLRGRGRSDRDPDWRRYRLDVYVADMIALLDALQIEQVVVVGTSLGGLVGMFMAAGHRARVAGLVMNDIGPEVDAAGLARISGYVGQGRSYPTWVHAARGIEAAHGAAFPDFTLDQWLEMAKRTMVVTQNGRISFDYDMAIAEPFAKPGNAAPPNLWLAYEALRDVPMLLVRGELSDLLSPDTVRQMGVRNPKLRSITVASGAARHELIAYARPDTAAARTSSYHVVVIPDGQSARAALASTLGIRNTVIKRRELLLWQNVRIHLDTVQDLGTFIEFEAVITTEDDRTHSPARIEQLRKALSIKDEHLVTTSYGDM